MRTNYTPYRRLGEVDIMEGDLPWPGHASSNKSCELSTFLGLIEASPFIPFKFPGVRADAAGGSERGRQSKKVYSEEQASGGLSATVHKGRQGRPRARPSRVESGGCFPRLPPLD
eukprot:GHVU01056148.1.p1 GENE.GHVU01056148.1~~GHVU01056148.1.p1  ORF type:complete len:115 (+),score=2.92 GHVU01056148.1:321-665(+)